MDVGVGGRAEARRERGGGMVVGHLCFYALGTACKRLIILRLSRVLILLKT